jgi:oligoribonuclease NrnB/cAMP/cGMP phosphodiesterase (DHH superfamily)
MCDYHPGVPVIPDVQKESNEFTESYRKLTIPLLIYHGNCADGFGAAYAFWTKYGNTMEYYPGVYSKAPPDVTGREVIFVDFSYKSNVIIKMLKTARSITIIDHHKSAMEDIEPLEHPNLYKHFDMNHSGAVLAWKYLYGDRDIPLALQYIEDRDLWCFKLQDSKAFSANLFSYPYSFEIWHALFTTMHLPSFIREGESILRKQAKDIDELCKQVKRRGVIGGHDVVLASLPYTLASDAGHILCIGEPFAACYWDTATHRTFSLRSNKEGLDVSLIALQYGGGGHKHSSGFSVNRNHHLAQI